MGLHIYAKEIAKGARSFPEKRGAGIYDIE
jgi:hypothetical protein